MKQGKQKRCRSCGAQVSQPHAEDCSNKLRNCEFKGRARREAKEGKKR